MSKQVATAVFFLIFSSFILTGENDSLPLKQENYFRYTYDNDFFNATDRYYTQGVRLELILNPLKCNPLSRILLRISRQAKNYSGIAFERDGFTPRSIRVDSLYRERPYAGISFLSSFLISIDQSKNQKLYSQLDLGIIGPWSRGAEEQKYIHAMLDNIQPLGWENQIRNDVILNYTLQYEKGILMKKYMQFIWMLEARAGTLYDDFSLGGTFRLGLMHHYFNSPGLSKDKNERKFQCYVFFRGKAKLVGYNATLQGGVFSKNNAYTLSDGEISRLVGITYAGIMIAYKRISLEYSKAYISSEFSKGVCHGWGRIGINMCF
jgi:lipid A 3-O-deacylase